ncbi:uncharacterized protein LOC128202324 [Galleria mellonella]|uniref:Uncharacterized protein LOC128202324 n=1 Tax=Galleria mellonella TaxID=7137 RepID=A0ABM3N3P2_GALME|nr:uncharacterized protein LOC128202324 [Galleria mellonella]
MAPTLPSELPVYADQVTDIGSFANLLTELSKFENHCHLRTEEIIEGVRYELKKFRQEFNTQSIASQPPFTSYAAVASKSKFVPAPKVKSNPALIISSTEEGSTNSHEVVSKWKENISFRQLGYAPCKIQPISKGRVRVEFDSPQHCKETIERTKSIQGLAAQEEKLKRPLLILKGISKSIAREEQIEIVCSQNSIQESNIRLCFLTSNRNSNLYNAVVEVSPDVRSTIVSLGRVNVEHQRVHAEDFSRFLQCFLCLQFGHTRAKCTAFEALDNNQIHDAVTQLTKDIHAACRRNIPKRTGNRDSNPWWNAELEALKKQCIKLHHRIHDLSVTGKPLGSTLDEYRALKAEYAKKISFASTQHFKEFCSAQGKEDVWAITNRLMKYSNNFRSPPQTVRIGQIHTDSCATTAAALLNHYFPDDGPDTSVQQRLLRAEANNIPDTDEDIPFTREEVEECLASISPNKAPGNDSLTSDICLHVFKAIPMVILGILNRCLQIGYFPENWKDAHIKIIPKPDKIDSNDVSAFRPIGLLPVFGKLLEKLFINRINFHIHQLGLDNPRQFGFKPLTSTTDALQHAINCITEAQSAGDQVVAVSLDIRAAFDNAWWPALFSRLKRINCPRNLYNLVLNYTKDRRVILDYGTATIQKNMSKGCIQGSACGPSLWNLILDGLFDVPLPEGCDVQAFADDVLLIVRGCTVDEIETRTRIALRSITEWGHSVKLHFGPAKTQAVAFTARARSAKIEIDQQSIPIREEIKLLGVIIDWRLKFIKHASHIALKASKLFNKLARITRPTWGPHPDNIATLYRQVIEPMFTYAAGIWGGAVRFTTVKRRLRTVQRQFAIRAIRAFRTVSAAAAIALAQFVPLHLKVLECTKLHKVKVTGTLDCLPDDIELAKPVKTRQLLHPAERRTFEFALANNEDDIKRLTAGTQYMIYTDGSKLDSGEVGAAAIIYRPSGQPVLKKVKLCRTNTVFTAELTAIKIGIQWLEDTKVSDASITILSDSRSALMALQQRSNREPTVNSIHRAIHTSSNHFNFVWVKAHVGIIGNEQADEAARTAATLKVASQKNSFPMSYARYCIRKDTYSASNNEYVAETSSSLISSWLPTLDSIAAYRKAVPISFAMTQIITGHSFAKQYLHRFRITDNNTCPCDNNSIQTIQHLLRDCPIFATQRHNHVSRCAMLRVAPYQLDDIISKSLLLIRCCCGSRASVASQRCLPTLAQIVLTQSGVKRQLRFYVEYAGVATVS